MSLRLREQGTVTMEFHIDADGTLLESRIVKSSGYRSLDLAAYRAFMRCKFHPEIERGIPIKSWLKTSYSWVIEESGFPMQ